MIWNFLTLLISKVSSLLTLSLGKLTLLTFAQGLPKPKQSSCLGLFLWWFHSSFTSEFPWFISHIHAFLSVCFYALNSLLVPKKKKGKQLNTTKALTKTLDGHASSQIEPLKIRFGFEVKCKKIMKNMRELI